MINAHNREILQNTQSKNAEHCKTERKLPNKGAFLQESLIYYATISCNDKNYKPKLYKKEVAKQAFTKHCSNRKKSFNVPPFYKLIPSYQRRLELKNEATKPTDILKDKMDIQALQPNFKTL